MRNVKAGTCPCLQNQPHFMDKSVFGRDDPHSPPLVGVIRGPTEHHQRPLSMSQVDRRQRSGVRYRGNNLCKSKDSNYSIDAENAHCARYAKQYHPTEIIMRIVCKALNPPKNADAEETNVETPFPPLFHVPYRVFHSMLQCACCHNRTFDRIDFSSLPACALRYSLKLRQTEMTAEHAG